MSLNKDGVMALVDRERDPKLHDFTMLRWKILWGDLKKGSLSYSEAIYAMDSIIQDLTGTENPYFEEEERNGKEK